VGSIFGFQPGDLGPIPSLRIILCFLPRQIWLAGMSKDGRPIEYHIYGANHGPS